MGTLRDRRGNGRSERTQGCLQAGESLRLCSGKSISLLPLLPRAHRHETVLRSGGDW